MARNIYGRGAGGDFLSGFTSALSPALATAMQYRQSSQQRDLQNQIAMLGLGFQMDTNKIAKLKFLDEQAKADAEDPLNLSGTAGGSPAFDLGDDSTAISPGAYTQPTYQPAQSNPSPGSAAAPPTQPSNSIRPATPGHAQWATGQLSALDQTDLPEHTKIGLRNEINRLTQTGRASDLYSFKLPNRDDYLLASKQGDTTKQLDLLRQKALLMKESAGLAEQSPFVGGWLTGIGEKVADVIPALDNPIFSARGKLNKKLESLKDVQKQLSGLRSPTGQAFSEIFTNKLFDPDQSQKAILEDIQTGLDTTSQVYNSAIDPLKNEYIVGDYGSIDTSLSSNPNTQGTNTASGLQYGPATGAAIGGVKALLSNNPELLTSNRFINDAISVAKGGLKGAALGGALGIGAGVVADVGADVISKKISETDIFKQIKKVVNSDALNPQRKKSVGYQDGNMLHIDFNDILPSEKNYSENNMSQASSGDLNPEMSSSVKDVPALLNEAARRYSVNPELVNALANQESGNNPRATSRKGAAGVMQLMPATAKAFGVKDPYDAGQNIDAGVRYLSQLIKKYNGNVELALMHYNGGSGAVDYFKKRGGLFSDSTAGPDSYANQTGNYVKNILSRMQH